MRICITNETSKPKMIPLPSGKVIKPKKGIEIDVSEDDYILLQKTSDFSVRRGEQHQKLFIKSQIENDKTLRAQKKKSTTEQELPETRLIILENKIDALVDMITDIHRQGFISQKSNSFSNKKPSPSESRRFLFEKIVEQNKQMRK